MFDIKVLINSNKMTLIPTMKSNPTINQLELFRLPDYKSVEIQIKQLEGEISSAIRFGDFNRAANLSIEQKNLLEFQIQSTN